MTVSISNPRRRGDDIQIRSALGLISVKPVSARGREWFRKFTGSEQTQLLTGDVETTLAYAFEQLSLQVVFNPISDTSEIRKIVSERLSHWRKSQIVT